VRSCDYRNAHGVEDEVLTVVIVRVGHRREVYRRL
jgi:mRNA-degrading endonuclease RelE of RelBE toxin-antitoxin system